MTFAPAMVPLNILHVLRTPVGGLFRHVRDLARGQIARGHRVGIVADSATGGSQADAALAEIAPSLALGVSRTPMRRAPGPADLPAMMHVMRRIAESKADVVHGHGAKGGAYVRMALNAQSAVRVYTPHGGSLHYDPRTLSGRLFLRTEKLLIGRGDVYIFESAYSAGVFRQKVGWPRKLARVVHNGVNEAEFAPVELASDACDLLFVGELRQLKGVDVLIEAMAILRDRGRRLTATLVGDGPDRAQFETHVARRGLQDAVHFAGALPARQAFTRGKLLVVPSRTESLPYIVLEAAAAGKPLITTRVGGIPEIFGSHAGLLVRPDAPPVLADAILDRLDRAEETARVTATLRQRVAQAFTIDTMVDGVLAAYDNALEARNGGARAFRQFAALRQIFLDGHFVKTLPDDRAPIRLRAFIRCRQRVSASMSDIPAPAPGLGANVNSGLSPRAMALAAKPAASPISPIVLAGTVRLTELALIAAIGLGLFAVYPPLRGLFWLYAIAVVAIAAVAMLAFQIADIYQVQAFRGHEKQYMRLASAWSLVFLLVIGASFFAKAGQEFSRVWLASYYVVGMIGLLIERKTWFYIVRHWTRQGRLTRRTVIVGGGDAGSRVIEALREQKDSGVEVIGLFDDRADQRADAASAGERKLGSVEDLVEFGRRTRVDLVIFSLPISAENRILQMLKKLWVLPVDIRLAAHSNKLRLRPRSYSYIGDVPVLDIADRPIADWDFVMKWLFDKIVGGAMLLCACPVMALVALAIKLDSKGPVFFKQKRYGFNNDLIEVYKFRSMYTELTDAKADKLVTKDDPRVTRVGRFIRKTSLDELPQLLNVVIKGNLSLVGPRPHAVNAKAESRRYDEAVDGYFARHRVKPGITGWAQVNGWRGETDTEEKIQKRVEHDLFYIENWSVLFDLYIVVRTPFALLKTENAY